MTNEQAKQEAIKKAYGEYYEPNFHHINENGLIHYISEPNLIGLKIYGDKFHSNGFGSFVLKELWDIENNNGWTRIEPDGSNLPAIKADCEWINMNSSTQNIHRFRRFEFDDLETEKEKQELIEDFTHYKPIAPPRKPIY